MPTTSNFGWTTPADTDLVKDGALAIRTLGNGIDTSMVDLKGGTTGQILSKATNTDMDFTWINNDQGDITEVQAGTGISVASGTGPIPVVTNTVATTFDAKGDLVVGTGADTFAKLTSSGTNNDILVVDTSTATGLKWTSNPRSGLVPVTPTSTANTGGTVTVTNSAVAVTGSCTSVSLNGVFTSTYDNYLIKSNWNIATASNQLYMRLRASGTDNTTSNYNLTQVYNLARSGSADTIGQEEYFAASSWRLVDLGPTHTTGLVELGLYRPNKAEVTFGTKWGGSSTGNTEMLSTPGILNHNVATAYDGFTIFFTTAGTSTFNGNVTVYGFNN